MAKVILQTLQASDSQKTYSDKANYNFHLLADYINGVKTIKGDKGNVGMPGATGRQGIQGERGNSLFVYGDEEKGQKFPSPDEKTYKDLKEKYVSWCEENGITDGDLVLFMDKEAIYKSGVNNEEKVPDIKKDLVVDLSEIISDFVDEKTKSSEFWDRIDQDRDIITLKQYLKIDYKKSREDAKIVLAPDMINNENIKGYVANKLAEAPLNIFSHIGSSNINDIYSYQSGISLNSIYVLNGDYNVEDKDREFRITQRSIRKDKNNTDEIDYVEGLFVVAPQTSSSNRDNMTSGFRFISKAEKDSDINSNTKKNNIVTIGDGKFTNGMLMNGYGGDNVENAITFARGNAEPVTDNQFGGFFSIGTEYDKDINGNDKIKGFIRTESRVGEKVKVKTGDLVVGGYDTFLTFSYDTDGNKIYTKNQNIKIYSVDGSIERGLYINNDKSILLTNENEASCNIKLDTQITQEVKKGDNTAKTEVFHQGIKNNVTASNASITNSVNNNAECKISNRTITNSVNNDVCTVIQTNRNDDIYDLRINIYDIKVDKNDNPQSQYFETIYSPLHITSQFNPYILDKSKYVNSTVWLDNEGLYKRDLTYSYWLNTYNKNLTITNVYGGDVLNLVYPLIPTDRPTVKREAFVQFRTYDTSVSEEVKTQWVGGLYLIPSSDSSKINRKNLRNQTKEVYTNYGLELYSGADLKINSNSKVSITASSIEIGDANSVVNIAGNAGRPYLIKKNGGREVFNWYCLNFEGDGGDDYIGYKFVNNVNVYSYFIKPPIINFTKDGDFYIGIDEKFFQVFAAFDIRGSLLFSFAFIYNVGSLNILSKPIQDFTIHCADTTLATTGDISMKCLYNNTDIDLFVPVGLVQRKVKKGELSIVINISISGSSVDKIYNDMCQSFEY